MALWRGPGGGVTSSLGTLEDMLRKSPNTGVSVGAPFQSRGTWYAGRACIPGTLIVKQWRAVVVGHLFAKDSTRATLREGLFTGEPER